LTSPNQYSISPELLSELDGVLRGLTSRIIHSQFPPDDESWYKFKGFLAAVALIKNQINGLDGPSCDDIVESLVPSSENDYD